MRYLYLIFFLLSGITWASPPVEVFSLKNGLRIIVKEDHRAPIAVVMLWYNVGSADEVGGSTGLSHVLEHLMYKGSKAFPGNSLSKNVTRIGGELNAITSNDYTVYYEQIPIKHLPMIMAMEADRMHALHFDATEFTHEMGVIREERRLRTEDNPQSLTLERFLSTAHLASPYHHPVVGWMSDLEHITMHDAQQWYQRYYAPNNATLVVVGDVSPTDIHKIAEHYFGSLPAKPIPSRKPQEEPPILGKKTVVVHSRAQIPLLILGYTTPTLRAPSLTTENDPYVLEVIAGILSAGKSSRLNKHLVLQQQVAADCAASYDLYQRYQTQFMLYASPSAAHDITSLRNALLTEIKHLQTTLIDAAELQRIKTQIIAQKTFEKESLFAQAMTLGLLETLSLGWQTEETYVSSINQVTPAQIQKIARRYFTQNNLTEAQLIPTHARDLE